MRGSEPMRPFSGLPAGPRWPATLLVVAMVIAACASPSPSPSTTPTSLPSASAPPPSDSAAPSPSGPPTAALEDVAAFDVTVEVAPDWPALLDGSLWVLAPDGAEPAVVRLDPASGAEQARVALPGGSCEMMAAGFDSIWACTPDGIVRIDPATNAIIASVAFQTPLLVGRFAVSEDALWSLSGEIVATSVARIDPATNAVTATYPLGYSVPQFAYGLGYLWATVTRDGLLLRIDPATGEVIVAASDLVDPFAVAAGAGHVWVGLQGAGTDEDPDPSVPDLFRFDPATGTGEFFDYGMLPEDDTSAMSFAVSDDSVWIKAEDPSLLQVDPESGEIVWVVTSDRGTGAIVVSDQALWMTVWRANSVTRIDL